MSTIPAERSLQHGFGSVKEMLGDVRHPVVHIGFPAAMDDRSGAEIFAPSQGFTRIMLPRDAACGLIHPPRFEFDGGATLKARLQNRPQRLRRLGNNVPVITCEGLTGNPYGHGFDAPSLAERLHHCFPHARIIIIVREQRRLIRALYARMVREDGMPHSLAWLLEHSSLRDIPGFSLTYLRYHGLVEHYQELFGSERVLVLPWELFQESPAEFLARLRRFADAPDPESTTEPPAPARSSRGAGRAASLAVIRRANCYLFYNGFNTRGWLPEGKAAAWARRRVSEALDFCLPGFLDARLDGRLTHEIAEAAQGFFADSNRRLQSLTGLALADYGYET